MKVCFGTTRTVLLIGKYAIKVPTLCSFRLFLYGLLGNIQEEEFSRSFKDEKVLAPVLFAAPGGLFNIMRRAKPLPMSDFEILNVRQWSNRGSNYSSRVKGQWIRLIGQRAIPVSDHTKIPEIISSLILLNDGMDKGKVVSRWEDAETREAVSHAVALVPTSIVSDKGDNEEVVLF